MDDRPIPDPLQMHEHLKQLMRGINAQVFQIVGNRVVYGPFKGMTVVREPHWDDGNSSAKVLGSYEFELEEIIRTAIERQPKTIVNVGCADGFYAVGFAMALPEVRVFAMDIDDGSLAQCWYQANENGVADRVQFFKGCNLPFELNVDAPDGRRLYFLDCEGAEETLLDKINCPALIKSDIIVECHDFLTPGISERLSARFADTHDVLVIRPELPPLGRYPFLAEAPSVMNLLAITEKRPMPTRWLACWAH